MGTASSMPASPSTPSLRRESSIASSYQSTGQVRPSIELFSEQTGPLVLAQQSHRILTLDNKDAQATNSYSPGRFNQTRGVQCNGCWSYGRVPSLIEHYALIDSYPPEWGLPQTLVVDEDLKAACIVQTQCFLKNGVAQEDFFQNQSSTSRVTKPNKSSKKAAKIASQPGDRQSQPQQLGYPTDAAQRGMLPIPFPDTQSPLAHSAFSNQHPPQLYTLSASPAPPPVKSVLALALSRRLRFLFRRKQLSN